MNPVEDGIGSADQRVGFKESVSGLGGRALGANAMHVIVLND